MKKILLAVLCAVLLTTCGGNKAANARLDELQSKNEQLTQRVRTLEDQLLDTQKQLIAQKQALQTITERQREMENYFDRLQVSRSSPQ